MTRPTKLLAALPAFLLLLPLAAPAAQAGHAASRRHQANKELLRLADHVTDGAREVVRTASGRHARFRPWGPVRNHGFHGPRDGYTLRLLADVELRAREFERALHQRPVFATHREFEALNRALERAAGALYRTRVSAALERDFDCLAEYMYSLGGYYQEVAYPRRSSYGFYDGRYDRRFEVYGPRRDISWRHDGWRGPDRDWDSDSDSDSY